jgi:hypothetical protein
MTLLIIQAVVLAISVAITMWGIILRIVAPIPSTRRSHIANLGYPFAFTLSCLAQLDVLQFKITGQDGIEPIVGVLVVLTGLIAGVWYLTNYYFRKA